MADIYLRSTDGSDADDGSEWALAKATLAAALTAAGAGGRVFMSQAHAETAGGLKALVSPGTFSNPVQILCVNDAAGPPTALATTGTVTTTSNYSIEFDGFAYVYGVTFSAGTGSSGAANILVGTANTRLGWIFDNCALKIVHTSADVIRFGNTASTSNDDQLIELRNTTIQVGYAAQTVQLRAKVRWYGGSVTGPTNLFTTYTSCPCDVLVAGVDLSALGSGKYLVNVSTNTLGTIRFRNCKLGAISGVINAAIGGWGAVDVFLDNCDSADTNYRMAHHTYQGSIIHSTAALKTGGASDGAQGVSHKMASLDISTPDAVKFAAPLAGPEIIVWNELIGAPLIATVDILHDSATNLDEWEAWLQVEYLGTSGYPLSSFATDHNSNVLALSATDQPASTATWSGADYDGMTNVNKQKLEATFTPQEKGIVRARVMLARANHTVYVDPLLSIVAA